MSDNHKRLIEDYLPIEKISAEASREKSVRKGHISTLHLWWARRPLVACRAAVYGALVPASRFRPSNGPEEKRESLSRANAARFVERLCKYPGDARVIAEAQRHILEAHAERLSEETGKPVTVEDILAGRAPRPKVLDMFAGGGAIPLEALRLGCEAYALDLNPVAHIIELCTLVYPQKFGAPDPNAKGSAKDGTWAGLAEEVRYWGNRVLDKVKAEIGDLYPPIPDPEQQGQRLPVDVSLLRDDEDSPAAPGHLVPVAYLWTRTVTCKNPACRADVPLVRQTWLCKKKGRYAALKILTTPRPSVLSKWAGEEPEVREQKCVSFEVAEAASEGGLGFDPEAGSRGGNATCPFCGTVADSSHVKAEGQAGRMGRQMMAIACTRPGRRGKVYLSADDFPDFLPDDKAIRDRIEALCRRTELTVPSEPIEANPRSMDTQHFGFKTWSDLFTPRQMLCLLTFAAAVKVAYQVMVGHAAGLSWTGGPPVPPGGYEEERAKAVMTYLATATNREAEDSSSLCRWNPNAEKMQGTFGRQALPMVWDFCEISPFGNSVGDWLSIIELQLNAVQGASEFRSCYGKVTRGSATGLPWPDASFDAVITDPPYYDNVSYSNLSDFFYVWLKRSIGDLYPEHFAALATPKKNEAIAAFYRHRGNKAESRGFYERMMAQSFREAHRVLKPAGQMVVVYAHKTTLGWSTLVDALRTAGFTVTEAWPLDTEMKSRLVAMETAALASSIFLVARKREGEARGHYEDRVRPELEAIVQERVASLWDQGVSGADLVIACVGAGLRAFTRFERVEYANGEEVPAQRFLVEVETAVLEAILARLSREAGANGDRQSLAGLDPPTRFYILWRYTYRSADLDAGEAIIFANGTHVELDGPNGLATGSNALLEKKKAKYRLCDFTERGDDEDLGLPGEKGTPGPAIDVLHRLLWLMGKRPPLIAKFLADARPSIEQLRLVAQSLAGPALKGGELKDISPTVEQSALARLLANWQTVMEGPEAGESRRAGQQKLI